MPSATANTLSLVEIGRQLQATLDPARILARPIDRIAFASDANLHRLIPKAVVQPVGTEEVRQLFAFSRENRIPLTFLTVGTSLWGRPSPMEYWWMGAGTGVRPGSREMDACCACSRG